MTLTPSTPDYYKELAPAFYAGHAIETGGFSPGAMSPARAYCMASPCLPAATPPAAWPFSPRKLPSPPASPAYSPSSPAYSPSSPVYSPVATAAVYIIARGKVEAGSIIGGDGSDMVFKRHCDGKIQLEDFKNIYFAYPTAAQIAKATPRQCFYWGEAAQEAKADQEAALTLMTLNRTIAIF